MYIILIKRFTFETLTISKKFKKLDISNKLKNKIYTHIYINHHYENEISRVLYGNGMIQIMLQK